MVVITTPQQTLFSMDLNPQKPIQRESRKAHPLIKRLFLSINIQDVPLAGRLKHFVGAWMKMTQDLKIFDIVRGYLFSTYANIYEKLIFLTYVCVSGGQKR